MRNDGQVLLAVLNFYVQIKIREATFASNDSVTDSTQPIIASVQKLPDSAVKSVELAMDRVDVSGETIRLSISLRLAVEFFTCNLQKRYTNAII
jgi:hypothetical protein